MDAMFLEPDGDFPNHEANPLNEETLHALQERIRATGAHLGFAYDGDADRLGVVDELGDTVPGDLVAALLVPFVLERHPGANILVPVNAGLALVEEIERVGGRAIMTQVGHGLIKPRMKRENAAFAGEIAYHYYFEDFYGADSPDYAMLLLLTLLSETGKPLSELVAPLRRYVPSGEINVKIADRDAVMKALDEKYAAHASSVERMDGVRFDFSDPADRWWFNVRPSNTEPLLRLTLEAATRELMETRREQLLALIRGGV
jgi:phosphomannomutase